MEAASPECSSSFRLGSSGCHNLSRAQSPGAVCSQTTGGSGQEGSYISNQKVGEPGRVRSKIVLKSVSRIVHNYKQGWPKRFYIYSNPHDDGRYRQYLASLRESPFGKSAIFIERVEDFLKDLCREEDVVRSVLFSQYSAINVKRYFKKVDQFILLGSSTQNCLPLLRKKTIFFTTKTEVMDSFLCQHFGLRNKSKIQTIEKPTEKDIATEKKKPSFLQGQLTPESKFPKRGSLASTEFQSTEQNLLLSKDCSSAFSKEGSKSEHILECLSNLVRVKSKRELLKGQIGEEKEKDTRGRNKRKDAENGTMRILNRVRERRKVRGKLHFRSDFQI